MSRDQVNQTYDGKGLNHSQLKSILAERFSEEMPDFVFAGQIEGAFYFQRIKKYGCHSIYEVFRITYSGPKEKIVSCSVSSCFDPLCVYGNAYNIGPLNPHKDLITIVKSTGVVSVEEAYYYLENMRSTPSDTIDRIILDFKTAGIRYLDNRFGRIAENRIINAGLDYITQLRSNPDELLEELEANLKAVKYQVRFIKHPRYIELKERLFAIKYGEKDERIYIPKLAYELLEYYCHEQKNRLFAP